MKTKTKSRFNDKLEKMLVMLENSGATAALYLKEDIEACEGDEALILCELREMIDWAETVRRGLTL